MKKIILTVVMILTGVFSTNAQEETFTLTVNISGLNSNQGSLIVGVYNTEDSFLKIRFKGAIIKIKDKKSMVIFKDLPKGEYAVSFVHDENNNKKMDTNFIGIPKEDFGCSNNATGFMGPPKYKDAKFLLEENKTIDMKP
ncbi:MULTISPECIES: DUF2141 domain-containing protein [unclassified Polaribacter]|uniref:DUF2141 domain-containing protein n=1 Tax=unclassified Polaribacter TaxID=196858 RepID=UPI0011BD9C14|nr:MULTISPECIES: DUF2141 domain-containing protein [unclassified Polaribacter]TXD54384.1 DUF2141 domain-containing protein [Polaribacter sp. IC063]TXD62785.1 DUF2141 domain-containing protein [Polaribacter sp. IC066]